MVTNRGGEKSRGLLKSAKARFPETLLRIPWDLEIRRMLSVKRGPLFLSESHRNKASPLSLVMWSKVVEGIAERAGLPRFTTHTPRHLRLTHMARAQMDLHQIATYAGHASIETSMLYIHLSGVELTQAVTRSLAGFENWLDTILGRVQR